MAGGDDSTWDFDGSGRSGRAAPSSKTSITPETPGRYETDDDHAAKEIGRGGLGRVVVVRDRHLGREVARKELLDPTVGTLRFLREARVTAQLEHPGIVPVYELGRAPEGTLYYTMKRVRGRTLADAIDHAPDLSARLELLDHFVDLCHAIAYAHRHGVVHRDIKPQNVMIGEFGETVVLDWGLAKVRGQADDRGGEIAHELARMADSGAVGTVAGATLGTPAYMSPEQARGEIDAVDERSDVWSLGCVLYEILAGRPPFVGASALDVLEDVRAAPVPEVSAHEAAAPPDLAAVAGKALERDPAERYATASELAEEVRAWRAGGRVRAYAYGHLDLATRAARRWRAALFATASVAALALVIGGASVQRVLSERDREATVRAETETALAEARAAAALGLADGAWSALAEGRPDLARERAARSLVWSETPSGRGAALVAFTACFVERIEGDGPSLGGGTPPGADAWSLTHDARALVLRDGRLEWSEAATGQIVRSVASPVPQASAVALAPDGRVLAFALPGGAVELWNLEASSRLAAFPATGGGSTAVAISADGRWLATAGSDGLVRMFDLVRGAGPCVVSVPAGVPVDAMQADDARLAVRAGAEEIRFLLPRRAGALVGHEGAVRDVAWSSGAVVSTGVDGTMRTWWPDTGVATDRRDVGPVRIHGADGVLVHSGPGPGAVAGGFHAAADGRRVAITGPSEATAEAMSEVAGVVVDATGGRMYVAGGGDSGWLTTHELATGSLRYRVQGDATGLGFLVADAKVQRLATGGTALRIWEAGEKPRMLREVVRPTPAAVTAAAFTPDDRFLFAGISDGRVLVYETATWELAAELRFPASPTALAASPTSDIVAVGRADGAITLLDRSLLAWAGRELVDRARVEAGRPPPAPFVDTEP